MACFHPISAYRTRSGDIRIGKEMPDSTPLRLPCGTCLGCGKARAKEWTIRCVLETHDHETTAFTTLTYDEKHLPVTLQKRHIQLFYKRLRINLRRSDTTPAIRHFSSGEYGERTLRPHYHAIIFGLSPKAQEIIERSWGMGLTHTVEANNNTIAYVAGYTTKKIGYRQRKAIEQLDPATGELYYWQPPFIQMSRRPGIGASAREYHHSWRLFALDRGVKTPVPRYLHEAWKQKATNEQKEKLLDEKYAISLRRDTSAERLAAAEAIAQAQWAISNLNRKL